jgi:tRNA (cmo5U34)-methyltransferase
MTTKTLPYDDPEWVARYIHVGPPAFLPGHAGMLQMAGILLAERMPDDGRLLIVGAGGGLETRYLAGFAKGGRFTGVDPSPTMLDLARTIAGPVAGDRLNLIAGTVSDAPSEPFDAATCILVMGLIPDDGSKLKTLKEIYGRLKTGAPFILVDQCIDRLASDVALRLDRYAAYARASGVDAETVSVAREKLAWNDCIVAPDRKEALLTEAGFKAIETFYVGMAWRGWVAYT